MLFKLDKLLNTSFSPRPALPFSAPLGFWWGDEVEINKPLLKWDTPSSCNTSYPVPLCLQGGSPRTNSSPKYFWFPPPPQLWPPFACYSITTRKRSLLTQGSKYLLSYLPGWLLDGFFMCVGFLREKNFSSFPPPLQNCFLNAWMGSLHLGFFGWGSDVLFKGTLKGFPHPPTPGWRKQWKRTQPIPPPIPMSQMIQASGLVQSWPRSQDLLRAW